MRFMVSVYTISILSRRESQKIHGLATHEEFSNANFNSSRLETQHLDSTRYCPVALCILVDMDLYSAAGHIEMRAIVSIYSFFGRNFNPVSSAISQ